MFWNRLARLLAKPAIANFLIRRAMKTPYLHLPSNENPSYMARYWVFNPYDRVTNKPRWFFCPWSIRIHHIKREDFDLDLHDHPWNARTIILKGWYTEKRLIDKGDPAALQLMADMAKHNLFDGVDYQATEVKLRRPGDTAKLGFGEYHTITDVDADGAWTLFISGPWRGVWGFLVNGVKIPWREYLGIPPKGDIGDKPISSELEELGIDPSAAAPGQYSMLREVMLARDPVTGIPRCGVCKGYGKYQDGDSGSPDDGYAPNIVDCDCADCERLPEYRQANAACLHCPGCEGDKQC